MKEKIVWKRMIYHGRDLGDFYLISNTGEIKGVKTGKIRKKNINHEGYYFVCVSLGSRQDKPLIKVHRAVAETFIDNKYNHTVINHKDGNKLNNNIDNLEWCTQKDNIIHAYKNKLIIPKGESIICLNNLLVFETVKDASQWCGCKTHTISDYLGSRKNIRKSAGKHPNTGEPLRWMYYNEYLKLKDNNCIS